MNPDNLLIQQNYEYSVIRHTFNTQPESKEYINNYRNALLQLVVSSFNCINNISKDNTEINNQNDSFISIIKLNIKLLSQICEPRICVSTGSGWKASYPYFLSDDIMKKCEFYYDKFIFFAKQYDLQLVPDKLESVHPDKSKLFSMMQAYYIQQSTATQSNKRVNRLFGSRG